MKKTALGVFCLGCALFAQDAEIAPTYFRSENNQIEEIHFETAAGREFMVLKFKNKLEGRNSRARIVADTRSNYGDSVSSFAYVQVAKEDRAKAEEIRMVHANQFIIDVVYTCGEQPDDKKRKLFPFYVETNCEVAALTVKKPKEKRGLW